LSERKEQGEGERRDEHGRRAGPSLAVRARQHAGPFDDERDADEPERDPARVQEITGPPHRQRLDASTERDP
jgi:hypothetical protein